MYDKQKTIKELCLFFDHGKFEHLDCDMESLPDSLQRELRYGLYSVSVRKAETYAPIFHTLKDEMPKSVNQLLIDYWKLSGKELCKSKLALILARMRTDCLILNIGSGQWKIRKCANTKGV